MAQEHTDVSFLSLPFFAFPTTWFPFSPALSMEMTYSVAYPTSLQNLYHDWQCLTYQTTTPYITTSCQSHLGAGEGHGADHLDCHHAARTGQPGDQAQSAWIYERFMSLA